MRGTTLEPADTFLPQSAVVEGFATSKSNGTTPSIASRLEKLAATETLSLEIETLLLLLIFLLGLLMMAYGWEQIFSIWQNASVSNDLRHLLR